MSDYRLIAMDMDGTLLNSKGAILEETADVLRQAARQGLKITLSTGRSLPAILPYRKILPLNAPVILFNGAMVADLDGNVLFHQPLEASAAQAVLASGQTPKSVCVWCGQQLFVPAFTPETAQYEKQARTKAVFEPEISRLAADGITKILWIDRPENHRKRKNILSEVLPASVSFYTSKPEYLEFVNRQISKGTALSFLCRYLNIKPAQTIAFGDGENDIPLLKTAGLGIAMANALPEVKAAADFVTASNDENGIGKIFPFIFPKLVL